MRTTTLLTVPRHWPGLAQGCERTRERTVKGQTSVEVVSGSTRLRPEQADAARLLALVRAPWRIENSLHDVRAGTLGAPRPAPVSSRGLIMLALTIRQPFAALILRGLKTVEFRSWRLPLGVDIALHSSRALPSLDDLRLALAMCDDPPEFESELAARSWLAQLPRGKVLGVVRCVAHGEAPEGYPFGAVSNRLEVVEEFEKPVHAIGQRGLWTWSPPARIVDPPEMIQPDLFDENPAA